MTAIDVAAVINAANAAPPDRKQAAVRNALRGHTPADIDALTTEEAVAIHAASTGVNIRWH